MNYGENKDICIMKRGMDGTLADDPRPYWEAMPKMRPGRYPDMDDCWMLEEDFYLRIKDKIYFIQKGFDFDGASIPKWAWALIGHPMEMWILLAALPHDGWYASNLIPRDDADWLFLEIIQACDRATPIDASWIGSRWAQEETRWSRRNKCWTAVRAAGGGVYPKSALDLTKYRAFVSVQPVPLEPLLSE
jgi:hypothetical protein